VSIFFRGFHMKTTDTPVLAAGALGVLFLAHLHGRGLVLSFIPDWVAIALWGVLLLPFVGLLFRNKLLVLLFLPAIVVHRCMRDQLAERRETALKADPRWRSLTVRTDDGIVLDAVQWTFDKEVPAASQRWLLWCSANAVCYEDLMPSLVANLGRPLRCNVVLFNYRGVGRSGSQWPETADDLYSDSKAMYQNLIKQGADPKRILIYGHSLGSAIGAAARKQSPDGPFCSDRSFSSLATTASVHATEPTGLAVATAIGLSLSLATTALLYASSSTIPPLPWPLHVVRAAGTWLQLNETKQVPTVLLSVYLVSEWALWRLLASQPADSFPGALVFVCIVFTYLWLGQVGGFLLWLSGGLRRVCPILLRTLGWEMDQVPAWTSFTGSKLLLYHPNDSIIPLAASLFEALGASSDRGAHAIELRKRWEDLEKVNPMEAGQRYHNYEVASTDEAQWRTIVDRLAALFPK